jgi:hypothetical protein
MEAAERRYLRLADCVFTLSETGRDAFNPFLDPRKLIQPQVLETLKTLVNADCEFLVRSHLRRVFTCFCQELENEKNAPPDRLEEVAVRYRPPSTVQISFVVSMSQVFADWRCLHHGN